MTRTDFHDHPDTQTIAARLQPLLSLSQLNVPQHNRRKTDRPQAQAARFGALPILQESWTTLKQTVSGVSARSVAGKSR